MKPKRIRTRRLNVSGDRIAGVSPHTAARVAGVGYLVIVLLGVFAEFIVRSGLVVPDDAASTTGNIQANELLFRVGISSYLVMAVVDAVVALALYVLLKPVNAPLALLAAWFRLIHAIILGIVLQNLFGVLHVLTDASYLSAFTADQLQAQVMVLLGAFNDGWLIGLVFFGLHCLALGYLILKSSFIPKILGALLIVAAAGYLIDSFAHFLLSNYADHEAFFLLVVAVPAFLAEVSLCLWLLLKGGNVQRTG
jgi:hypothetical protein